MLRLWLCLLLLRAPVAVALAPTPDRAVTALVEALNAHDAGAAAALFSEDGEWLPPDGPPARGRTAVQAALAAALQSLYSIDTLTRTVDTSGRLSAVRGRLTVSHRTAQLGTDISAGHYVVLLRREADGWRITACLFNLPLRPDIIG